MTRITVIDGHPDPAPNRFIHALARTYGEAARLAGHDVQQINLADLDFPIIRSQADWATGAAPDDIQRAQQSILDAGHLVILYPLWLGDVPALLKAFLEQVARPSFAFRYRERGCPEKLLRGRSARLIVTMGMPSLYYRLVYRAHSVRSLARNILAFTGIGPIRVSIVGSVDSARQRERWITRVDALGRRAR